MTEHPIASAVDQLPTPDPAHPFGQERARLQGMDAPQHALPGVMFPDPTLVDPTGASTSISQIRADQAAVVVLYRGSWCPFCNIALRVYRDELSEALSARGIRLIAVSPQASDGSLTMQEKHELDFAVLSDTGNQIAKALGVLTHPSDAARQAQLNRGLDLEQVNADGTIELPMPTVAIVGSDGRLAWIDVHPDYTTRTEPAQVLAALEGLGL
ncbi:MAG TPA: peroxiredoxin-like family protein [Galbitalea sp.]|jgi:peroxiredoxin